MTYNAAVPAAPDDPTISQVQMLTNFGQLNTIFGNNHETFDAGTGDVGKHLYCQFPEQVADPATAANEGAVYTKVGPVSAVTELFFRRESSGVVEQLTGSTVVTVGTNFGITLPFGIVMNWGTATIGGGGVVTVTYAVAFPAAVQYLGASKQAVGAVTSRITVDRLSLAQANLYEGAGNVLAYLAIGI